MQCCKEVLQICMWDCRDTRGCGGMLYKVVSEAILDHAFDIQVGPSSRVMYTVGITIQLESLG